MLRVTRSATFGRLYISPQLPEFLALHPRAWFTHRPQRPHPGTGQRRADLAIRIGNLDDLTLIARAQPRRAVRRAGAPAAARHARDTCRPRTPPVPAAGRRAGPPGQLTARRRRRRRSVGAGPGPDREQPGRTAARCRGRWPGHRAVLDLARQRRPARGPAAGSAGGSRSPTPASTRRCRSAGWCRRGCARSSTSSPGSSAGRRRGSASRRRIANPGDKRPSAGTRVRSQARVGRRSRCG